MQARIGYRFTNGWKIVLDGFNIANSRSDMIDYQANVFGRQDFALFPNYTGGSALGISERVFKPIDPPAFRITISGPLSFDGTPALLRCRSRRRAFLIINKSADAQRAARADFTRETFTGSGGDAAPFV